MTIRQLASGLALGVALMLAVARIATAQSSVYLPLMPGDNKACKLPMGTSPSAENPQPAQASSDLGTSDLGILPLGSQLDDVGQYYSQVAPSLSSIIRIANITSASQSFTLTLYGDTGNMVRSLHDCRISAGDIRTLQVADGQLAFDQDGRTIEPQSICGSVAEGKDAQGYTAARLHGLYQAQISAGELSSLAVQVYTRNDPAFPQATSPIAGEYAAVAGTTAAGTILLPGLVATRDRGNWWDTEVIVQNVSGASVNLQFNLCSDDGYCFDNNVARLEPNERRLFLASHLLYDDTRDGLVERAGWYSASVSATTVDPAGDAASIAVAVNYFRQEVEDGELHPKAEQGSQCLISATPPLPGQVFELPVNSARPWHVRIYNPSFAANVVRVSRVDETGRPLDTWSTEVGPYSTLDMGEHDLATLPDQAGGSKIIRDTSEPSSRVLRIQTDRPVSVLGWDELSLLQPDVDAAGSNIWYAPLVAAPVIPFRWDDNSGPRGSQRPDRQFGLAETMPQIHELRPAWARELNWYDANYNWVGFEERWCYEMVAANNAYSTYIPLWHGLKQCNPKWSSDRSCVNTVERLQRVRNTLPSSCAGRPLLLANEPDLGNQGSMTFHELGRLIYVLRDWPGQLFSPAFASYSYERPIYPPEQDDWCRQAVAESLCPQTPGCHRCRQDGVVDGTKDPYDISFKGLEEYFAEPHRWTLDQMWRFEDFVDGMVLHFYQPSVDILDDQHWRAPFLHQYRDRATEAGWPIIVKEYGFAVWKSEFGVAPGTSVADIADRLDNSRRFLQKHLGNGEEAYGGNPFKLIWYQTGCEGAGSLWGMLCLFQTPERLSEPVGICWHYDATHNDETDWQCGETGPLD